MVYLISPQHRKGALTQKRFQVNMNKTKIFISNPLAEHQVKPSKCPCGVCNLGNSLTITVEFGSISLFKHKRLFNTLNQTSYARCVARKKKLYLHWHGNGKLGVAKPCCYLEDVTSESKGCYNKAASWIRSAL